MAIKDHLPFSSNFFKVLEPTPEQQKKFIDALDKLGQEETKYPNKTTKSNFKSHITSEQMEAIEEFFSLINKQKSINMGKARRFECKTNGAYKFWSIQKHEDIGSTKFATTYSFTTNWGRIGNSGSKNTKAFSSLWARDKTYQTLIQSKLKKGYVEVDENGKKIKPILKVDTILVTPTKKKKNTIKNKPSGPAKTKPLSTPKVPAKKEYKPKDNLKDRLEDMNIFDD